MTGQAAQADEQSLARTLTAGQATALGVSIVVGSGLLILPGLAYQMAGRAAMYGWMAAAALVVPLLFIFAWLGSRYPTAGGIAGFVDAAFGRTGAAATELVLVGTFSLGIPAIALTGGGYVMAAADGGEWTRVGGAAGLLVAAGAVNLAGARVSGRLQQVLAYGLVLLLAAVALTALGLAEPAGEGMGHPDQWSSAIPVIGLVFFAFTGWEMLSFTAEEYRNPRRDFPIAVAASFMIVVVVYLLVAIAVQQTLAIDAATTDSAPIAALLGNVLGHGAQRSIALIGVAIIVANLVGAVWAGSRLVYASARAGLLPRALSRIRAHGAIPRASLLTCVAVFLGVAGLEGAGLLSIELLLRLAGQNFFLLYAATVVTFVRLAPGALAKGFGFATLSVAMVTMGTFGWTLLYPLALAAGGIAVSLARARQG